MPEDFGTQYEHLGDLGPVFRSIEDRLRLLEDVEAVRTLMARYHAACDGWEASGTHRIPEEIAGLFTDDGVWDVTAKEPAPSGPIEVAALATSLQSVPWIFHFVANPIVDIDGDIAHASFKGVLRVRLTPTTRLVWALGLYRAEARRTEAGWRLQYLGWEPASPAVRLDLSSLEATK